MVSHSTEEEVEEQPSSARTLSGYFVPMRYRRPQSQRTYGSTTSVSGRDACETSVLAFCLALASLL